MTAEPAAPPLGLDRAGLADLQRRLGAAVGADAVWADARRDAYAVDGRRPALVASPATPEEVAACLAEADALGAAVIPCGGGTARGLGYPPRAADLALDLRRLDRVLQYEPADLTVCAQAGITLGALNALLARHGQRLALDCAFPAAATLGGTFAANLAGPHRLRYGTLRDLTIGICVAGVDGALAHGGGRVVKNVSGYDMMKLHLGALGTLGVITELNLKVAPRPATAVTLGLGFPAAGSALAAAEALLDSPLLPAALTLVNDALASELVGGKLPAWVLCIAFEGAAAPVARQAREVRERASGWSGAVAFELDASADADWWQPLMDVDWRDAGAPNRGLLKIAVLPTAVESVLDALRDVSAEVGLSLSLHAEVALGLVYARVGLADDQRADVFGWALGALQAELVRRFGSSVVCHCPTEAKTGLAVWGREPPSLPLMRALKTQFDSRGILNPGRFVGGI